MEVISKQVHLCPYCMTQQDDYQNALTCLLSCRAKKAAAIRESRKRSRIGNEIRLKVENLEDIQPYLIEFCDRMYGVKLRFAEFIPLKIIDVSCTHAQPIGKPMYNWYAKSPQASYYKGCRGHATGTIERKNSRKEISFSGLFGGGFSFDRMKYPIIGFHTGTGSGLSRLGYEFYWFLEDFPILWKKYQENWLPDQQEEIIQKL